VPALEATLLMFVEPVLSPVWAWIVHGETAGPWVVAGGVVILGATAVYMGVQSGRFAGLAGPHPPD
jgi:drug/metabolite transporter (DMT)-like permease